MWRLLGVGGQGHVFAIPTYLFMSDNACPLIGFGIYQLATGVHYTPPADAVRPGSEAGTIGLGCTASVTGARRSLMASLPSRNPEWRNARTTLIWTGILISSNVLGMSFPGYSSWALSCSRDGDLSDRWETRCSAPAALDRLANRHNPSSWCWPPAPLSPTFRGLSSILARDLCATYLPVSWRPLADFAH